MGRMPNDHNPPGGISTRLVSLSPDSADPPRLNDHDSFAEAYSALNETSLIGGYFNRPAILDLAGDVAGRRILDAGLPVLRPACQLIARQAEPILAVFGRLRHP